MLLLLWLALLPSLCQAQSPTITSFSPTSGAQGSTVTVTGANLTGTTSVRFGELPAVFSVASDTQLNVTVPRGASTHRLQVTTPAGAALSATAFEVSKGRGDFYAVVANINNLNVGQAAAPALTDLDGDGLLDLLVGESDGNINRYEQTSINSTAVSLRTATFNNIDVGTYSTPAFTDLDGDGLLDMLVGEFDGNLNHYEQVAANSTSFTLVTAGFNSIDVGLAATPAFTDLDGDGLLDLLVGEDAGNLNHYEQTAVNSSTFALRTASFNSIDVGAGAAPAIIDRDGDGLLDMLVGKSNGTLSHYEQGTANSTTFTLVTASFGGIQSSSYLNPTFTDLDGDGLLDLIVGEDDGSMELYEQVGPPTISSFSPTNGAQGSTVTVTGANLTGTTSVRFGELPAAFTVSSATQLSVTVPRGASTHRLQVTTPAGAALSATAFRVSKTNSYRFPAVTAAFSNINVGSDSAPAFADPDGDGLLDLLVGKNDGTLNQYEQVAANSTSFTLVTASFNSIDVGLAATPAFTDLDGDGLLDLIVGEDAGNLNHYEQTAVNSSTFALRTASFNSIDVGSDSTPSFTDLDGDGLLDLLVGEQDGNLNHYEQAAANSTSFTLITASFNGLAVGTASVPAFIDLDGDGLLDLLVGEQEGNLNHYEQTATHEASFTLVTDSFNSIDVGLSSALAFTDLDGDGLLDLLVGESDGNLNHYEQVPPAPTITSFSPVSGAQGSTVVVSGTNLTYATSVRFGEHPAAFTITTATQLRVIVPRGASTHKLAVTTLGGTALSTTAFGVEKPGGYTFSTGTADFSGVDVGTGAAPALADLDGDGLLDLLVGRGNGTLNHYEQAATNATSFALVTASFSAIDVGDRSAPAITDLDGDGLLDLLVGETNGTLGHYKQAAANSASFVLVTAGFNTIDVGFWAAPAFTDLDGDGLLDLLVGEQDGNLNHYEQAAANSTSFTLITTSFNGLAVGAASVPAFIDLDGNGRLDLLVGEQDGNLNHFEQAAANSTSFALVTATFGGWDVGSRSTPAFTDLDGDGLLDMLIGKGNGFLNHYEQLSAPLPVVLTQFTATAQGATAVRLAWATASEHKSHSFEVERSTDGRAFASIGSVAAAGSSPTPRHYHLLDEQLPASARWLYYRLRQLDQDGSFSYSPVRVVSLDQAEKLTLAPNPARSATLLRGTAPGAGVQVFDTQGRLVLTATADAGGTAPLALPHFPAGVYLVRSGGRTLRLLVE